MRWLQIRYSSCLFIAIVLLSSAYVAVAQPKILYFNQIDQTDGLPDLSNEWVYKDSKGLVWISSSRGLVQYNSNRVRVFQHVEGDPASLPDDIIQSSFFEDEETNIWFSTYSSLTCYVRKHDHFKRIPLPLEEGENGFHVPFVDPERGLALLVNQKTLRYFDPKTGRFTAQHEVKDVLRIVPLYNNNGKLTGVVGYNYSKPGLHVYQYNQQYELVTTKHVFSGETGRGITLHPNKLVAENDTLVWIAAATGFYKFNPISGSLTALNVGNKDPYYGVALLGDAVLTIGKSKNIEVYDKKTGAWKGKLSGLADKETGIGDLRKRELYVDRDGAIWLSIFDSGIYFCHPDNVKFTQITPAISDTKFNDFTLTTDRQNRLWCLDKLDNLYAADIPGALNEVVELHPKHFEGINDEIFYFFIDTKENKWALAHNGLYKAEKEDIRFKKISSGYFLFGLELADGRVLFSKAENGLWIWDGQGLHPVEFPNSSLHLPRDSTLDFTNFFEDTQGLVYACENLKDLWVLSAQQGFQVLQILPINADVFSFYQPPGENKVWMGTNTGLSFIDTKTREIHRVDKNDGISVTVIYSILGDTIGRLWLGSNKGLVCYDEKKKRSIIYDQSDGLLGMAFPSNKLVATSPYQFWLGNPFGVNAFNPYTLSPSPRKPQVALINLLINDQERKPVCVVDSATNIAQVRHIMLKPNERTISFDVAVMDYANPGADSFRYQMANYDPYWVTAPAGERIRYPNLPAGEYTLNVVGVNMQGVESDPISLKITVFKKLYERWWFYPSIILFLGALLVSGVRYYYKQQIREVELRNQISADLHDDIGASMSNIGILITLIRQRLVGNGETATLLNRVDEEVASSSEAIDDIIWSINPINDSLDRVLARMRRFASEVFEAKDINGTIQFPQNMQGLRLGLEKRRQFYLLFKEAVNNLAKYAQCTQASIVVEYHQRVLFLAVSDNGVGFNVEENMEKGNGLKTMAERARKLNVAFTIESTPGKGTNIQVKLPITEKGD